MKTYGIINLILNELLALAKYEGHLKEGEEVEAFILVKDPIIKAKTGKEEIVVPKGTLTVIAYQGDNLYLLRTGQLQETTIVNQGLGIASLFSTEKIVKSTSPSNAVLDKNKSLNISYNLKVEAGDFIRKKDG